MGVCELGSVAWFSEQTGFVYGWPKMQCHEPGKGAYHHHVKIQRQPLREGVLASGVLTLSSSCLCSAQKMFMVPHGHGVTGWVEKNAEAPRCRS